jgi:hypothetical protein
MIRVSMRKGNLIIQEIDRRINIESMAETRGEG